MGKVWLLAGLLVLLAVGQVGAEESPWKEQFRGVDYVWVTASAQLGDLKDREAELAAYMKDIAFTGLKARIPKRITVSKDPRPMEDQEALFGQDRLRLNLLLGADSLSYYGTLRLSLVRGVALVFTLPEEWILAEVYFGEFVLRGSSTSLKDQVRSITDELILKFATDLLEARPDL